MALSFCEKLYRVFVIFWGFVCVILAIVYASSPGENLFEGSVEDDAGRFIDEVQACDCSNLAGCDVRTVSVTNVYRGPAGGIAIVALFGFYFLVFFRIGVVGLDFFVNFRKEPPLPSTKRAMLMLSLASMVMVTIATLVLILLANSPVDEYCVFREFQPIKDADDDTPFSFNYTNCQFSDDGSPWLDTGLQRVERDGRDPCGYLGFEGTVSMRLYVAPGSTLPTVPSGNEITKRSSFNMEPIDEYTFVEKRNSSNTTIPTTTTLRPIDLNHYVDFVERSTTLDAIYQAKLQATFNKGTFPGLMLLGFLWFGFFVRLIGNLLLYSTSRNKGKAFDADERVGQLSTAEA